MRHTFRTSTSFVLLYAAVCLPQPAPMVLDSFPEYLPLNSSEWSQEVGLGVDSDVAVSSAATFAIGAERPYGATLEIGPWAAGHRQAVYRYKKKFQGASGTLRGVYRTESMFPAGIIVTASFYKGAKELGTQVFNLEPVSAWSGFQIPLRFSPPGTDSVSLALGVAQKHFGKVFFSNLHFSKEDRWPLGACLELSPLTRPKNTTRFQPSGYFRIQNTSGYWSLVTPDGRPVYSTGVAVSSAEEAAATAEQFKLYRAMGFNSVGVDTNFVPWVAANSLFPHEELWLIQTLNTSLWAERQNGAFDRLLTARGETSTVPGQGAEHFFPDPFDPKFAAFYRNSVHVVAQYLRNMPWFVGYYADAGLGFTDLPRRVWSHHAGEAFVHFLLVKYGPIGALNRVWDKTYSSFEELAASKPDPEMGGAAMKRDFALFAREIVKRYVGITASIIRDEDPNHLIFSNRFTSGPELLEALPYLDLFTNFDGVAIDLPIDNVQAGMTPVQRGQLELLYRATGRPLLVSSTTLAARDSGYYDKALSLDSTFWHSVPDQRSRANQVGLFFNDLYNTPYVIGAHWASYRDAGTVGPVANVGLVKQNGDRYMALTDMLASLNHRFYEPGAKAPAPVVAGAPVSRVPVSTEGLWQTKTRTYPGRAASK